MKINPLHLIDAYKYDHRRQYPEGTQLVFSNFTPRNSRIPGVDKITFFGLQYYLKQYLIHTWNEGFFTQNLDDVLREFNRRKNTSLGPNQIGDSHISALHKLGYLPIKILALPEGSVVPIKVPMLVMWNTHPDFFWLTNYLETSLSACLWQMCNSATIAREYKKLFLESAVKTGGNLNFVPFQGHDFSFRGMSSVESAAMSGAAHLLFFLGTDTIPAVDFLEQFYEADCEKELIGASVPATEHAVMCMGMKDGEFETFRRLVTEIYPGGIVSIVSDTWDLWTVLTDYLPRLKNEIMAREGKVVIRPDSGNPVDIICGKQRHYSFEDGNDYESGWENIPFGEAKTNKEKGIIELLWDVFGGTVNEQGYKVLNPHIGCIYGDAITIDRAREICTRLKAKGFASTNWVAGIGSYTYQYNTRDTLGFAMKATYGEIEEIFEPSIEEVSTVTVSREIFKDPITDSGEKKSAKGLIAVHEKDGTYFMKDQVEWKEVNNCAFEPVFEDGILLRDHTLSSVRKRTEKLLNF